MGAPAIDLLTLGAQVEWTSFDAATAARENAVTGHGRMADLVEWLSGAQDGFPPRQPKRPRCLVFGRVGDGPAAIADSLGIGVRAVEVDLDQTVTGAFAAGVAAADSEADEGTDLVVVADPDTSDTAALLVSLLTTAEPVAMLPRGAAAVDTAAWISRAEYLRDARRAVSELRNSPAELLEALGHAPLAATVGFLLRSCARRTAVVLDGSAAAAAALVAHRVQPRVSRWWRFADTSPDRLHVRVLDELDQSPILGLGTSTGDGTAGLLAVAVVRAAVQTQKAAADE